MLYSFSLFCLLYFIPLSTIKQNMKYEQIILSSLKFNYPVSTRRFIKHIPIIFSFNNEFK